MATGRWLVIGLVAAGVVVFFSGFRLSRAGWPYGTGLLTIHKLVALAAVVAIGVEVVRAGRAASLSALDVAVISAAGVLTVAMFASGGVVSAIETAPAWVVRVHRIAPWFTALLSAASVYLVTGRG